MSTPKRKLYWSNIFRIRYWAFTVGGAFVLGLLASFVVGDLGPILSVILVPLLGYFWLGVRMACPRCGRIIAANSVAGAPTVCSHCGEPLDDLAESAQKEKK